MIVAITVLTPATDGDGTARLRTSDGVSTNDPSKGVRRLPPSPTGRAPSLRSVTDPHSGKTIAQLRGMSETDLIAAQDEIASESGSYSTADDYAPS